MKLYLNELSKTLIIDVGLKHITIDLPPGLSPADVSEAMQSETVLTIIRQLVGEAHGK